MELEINDLIIEIDENSNDEDTTTTTTTITNDDTTTTTTTSDDTTTTTTTTTSDDTTTTTITTTTDDTSSACPSVKLTNDVQNQDDVILETINHNGHFDYIVKRSILNGNIRVELLIAKFNTKYHIEGERLIDYYDNGKVVYVLNNNIISSTLKTSSGEYFMSEAVQSNVNGLRISDVLNNKSNLYKNIMCGTIYVADSYTGNTIIEGAKCMDLSCDGDGITEILIKNVESSRLSEDYKDIEVQVAMKYNDEFVIIIASGVIRETQCNAGIINYAIIDNLEIPHITNSVRIPQCDVEPTLAINVTL